jgi:hypothetical protein
MIRIEFECPRDFPNISLVFNNLLDSFELELRGKGALSPTSFNHASSHFHCFNINRISRCPELPIHYIVLLPGVQVCGSIYVHKHENKIMMVCGTRPEITKMAPVFQELRHWQALCPNCPDSRGFTAGTNGRW